MKTPKPVHRCTECGAHASRWSGRCGACGAWNAVVSEDPPAPTVPGGVSRRHLHAESAAPAPPPLALVDVDPATALPRPTGVDELDRVLGGGLVPGSVTLVGGEPGVGKSTLLLQVLCAAARRAPALLVCAEESAHQVRLRAERLGALPPQLFLWPDTDVPGVSAAMAASGAELVVVDSVQAVRDPSTTGPAGSVSQVRACAELLVDMAKSSGVPVVLVGHVTKDGALAGPRLLEHVVDTVLQVEGDRHHSLRTVRAVKHRFGRTGELGLFRMDEGGLCSVPDPYALLLGDRQIGQPGSAVLPTVEGRRALLVEVQALVAPGGSGVPTRRQAQGIDAGRLAMLLAVLDARADQSIAARDVFASVVGGMRVAEPGADLALAMALWSAATGKALPPKLVVFGEVGLGGEIRQVRDAPVRLAEAHRLGFAAALAPRWCPDGPDGMTVIRVDDLAQCIAALESA
ncbi:MAG: DNA repair protein RadA [Acidimicrobiales bacterium]